MSNTNNPRVIVVSSHDTFAGYINISELISAELVGYRYVLTFTDDAALKLVTHISADIFDAEQAPDVLKQVVQEHIASYGPGVTFTDIYDGLTTETHGDTDNLIGTVTTFIDDPSIYLYLAE